MDPQVILATSHGRRSIDVLQIVAPERANMDYVMHVESLIPKLYADGATELPGTRDIITSLTKSDSNWAIVTSGTMALAGSWLKVMALPDPDVFITAEQVKNGKPDPEGYLMAKQRFAGRGKVPDGSKVLVVEDAPAGIKAGKAAGCYVIGLVTTHTRDEAFAAGADWIVDDLSKVEFIKADENGGFELRISGEVVSR